MSRWASAGGLEKYNISLVIPNCDESQLALDCIREYMMNKYQLSPNEVPDWPAIGRPHQPASTRHFPSSVINPISHEACMILRQGPNGKHLSQDQHLGRMGAVEEPR